MKPDGTCLGETWYSVDAWNSFQIRVKPVLVCSVDRTLDSSSPWDEISYGRNGGQDTDILSSGVVCKNSHNWNRAVLVRS